MSSSKSVSIGPTMIMNLIDNFLPNHQESINNNVIFDVKANNRNISSPSKSDNENWDAFIDDEPIYEKTDIVQNTVNNSQSINKNMGPTSKSDNNNWDNNNCI